MPDKKIYSKVMSLKDFCIWYLNIIPKSTDEMIRIFVEYKSRKRKIEKGVKIKGRAMGGGVFATTETEYKRVYRETINPAMWIKKNPAVAKWSGTSITAAALGVRVRPCNHLVVLHFWALDDEVQEPTREDARSDMNWMPGGRTKNLITGTTDDGVKEVVIKPLPAKNRIKEVDYIGHVDYNL